MNDSLTRVVAATMHLLSFAASGFADSPATFWLVVFVLPLLLHGRGREVPWVIPWTSLLGSDLGPY